MATIVLRSSQSTPLTNSQVDANFSNINSQLENVTNVIIPTLAPKVSPAFSGTPTVPTAAQGTNTIQVASTAYVYNELEARKSAALPAMSGIASIGSTDRFAREDHVHPTDTSRAPVSSPTFTGTATSDYFSGNGSSLTNLNASNLSTGTVPNDRLTVASLISFGVTRLQSTIDSSETVAATPAAVKVVHDLANAALPKSGGTMAGPIVLAGPATTDLNPVTKKQLDAAFDPFVGMVAYFPTNTPPTGWLKANGAAVSRTIYARLFERLGFPNTGDGVTTFNLPDLRGEFVRGLDDGRGVDTGRALGSAQADALKSHTHTLATNGASNGNNSNYPLGGAEYYAPSTATTGATGGTETRPRNIALLACIKF